MPEAAVIPRKNLEAVATPIAKEKEMTRQIEALTHQGGEPIDRATQIRRPGRDIDANRR